MNVKRYALLCFEPFNGHIVKYVIPDNTEAAALANCVQRAAACPNHDFYILKREKVVKRTKYSCVVKYSIVWKFNHKNGYGLQLDILYKGGGVALIKQTCGEINIVLEIKE